MFQLTESHCTPYALASFYAMDRTIRWWGRKHGRDEMTEFVFEEGDKNKGDFMWMMEQIIRGDRRRFEKVAPVFKRKELVALQAADLVGWTMRRAMKVERTNVRERSIPPAVLEALVGVRHIPHLAGYLDRDKLMKFCENFGVPRRGEAGTWAGIVRH